MRSFWSVINFIIAIILLAFLTASLTASNWVLSGICFAVLATQGMIFFKEPSFDKNTTLKSDAGFEVDINPQIREAMSELKRASKIYYNKSFWNEFIIFGSFIILIGFLHEITILSKTQDLFYLNSSAASHKNIADSTTNLLGIANKINDLKDKDDTKSIIEIVSNTIQIIETLAKNQNKITQPIDNVNFYKLQDALPTLRETLKVAEEKTKAFKDLILTASEIKKMLENNSNTLSNIAKEIEKNNTIANKTNEDNFWSIIHKLFFSFPFFALIGIFFKFNKANMILSTSYLERYISLLLINTEHTKYERLLNITSTQNFSNEKKLDISLNFIYKKLKKIIILLKLKAKKPVKEDKDKKQTV